MSGKTFDAKHAAEYGYTREDWESVESPEANDEQISQARMFSEAFPELHNSIPRKRGPSRTKTPVSIRLDDDLVAKLRSSGPGWQARVNDALHRWIDDAA